MPVLTRLPPTPRQERDFDSHQNADEERPEEQLHVKYIISALPSPRDLQKFNSSVAPREAGRQREVLVGQGNGLLSLWAAPGAHRKAHCPQKETQEAACPGMGELGHIDTLLRSITYFSHGKASAESKLLPLPGSFAGISAQDGSPAGEADSRHCQP